MLFQEFFQMDVHPFPLSLLHFIITTFFILIALPASYCDDDGQYSACNHSFNCGIIQDIRYPFWGYGRPQYCGRPRFELKCEDDKDPLIGIDKQTFRVLHINQSTSIMTIAPMDFQVDGCLQKFIDTTLNEILFNPVPNVSNLKLFYRCPLLVSREVLNNFNCTIDGNESGAFYVNESNLQRVLPPDHNACSNTVEVPVFQMTLEQLWIGAATLQSALIRVGYYTDDLMNCSACQESGGVCGPDWPIQFVCLCRDQPHNGMAPAPAPAPENLLPSAIPRSHGLNWERKLAIAFGAAGFTILVMCVIFIFCRRRRNKKHYARSSFVSRNISSDPSSMTELEMMGKHFGFNIFTYSELEKATNNFDSNKELGDGGFGTVYYGKLRDGRGVAVKRLYENNYKRVEQFMNEVEILTRLRHQNLVALYGCTSRHSRELLLVYEYIPNGTVADHLHGERAKPGSLPWHNRMSIAIETASALKYLHASDIIHRDVKTTNILLDNNFNVKVADFGLSRLFPTDVTHVSTAPQGTPGYVDPEYHQCYQLTDKSDVYSFGVVLIELISSKPAVDITRHRHEINLSNMAINKIQNHALHELVDPCLGFESDKKVRNMITAVAELAFQCLQNEKEMRPSMEEVLETLKDIQSDVYNVEKAEEADILADNVVLLKSGPLPTSPDSVTAKWISTSTTPNASG